MIYRNNLLNKLIHDFATPVTALLNIVDFFECGMQNSTKQMVEEIKDCSQQMRTIIELWRKLIINVDDDIGEIDCHSYCGELIISVAEEKKITINFIDNKSVSIQNADFVFKFLFILIDFIKYDAEINIELVNDNWHFQFLRRDDFSMDLLKKNEFFDELIDIKALEKKFAIDIQSNNNFYYLKLNNK